MVNPFVGDSVVEVGRVQMGFLCEKNMGKGFPIGVSVRSCPGDVREALTKHQGDEIAFRGGNQSLPTSGWRDIIDNNLEGFHLDRGQDGFVCG